MNIVVCVKQVPDTGMERKLKPDDSTLDRESVDGLINELDAVIAAIQETPWTALTDSRGNAEALKKIDDAQALLANLRKALSSWGSAS